MAILKITLPDEMNSFVESKIGPGKFKDANAYAQWLIAEDMERQAADVWPEDQERIDQLLLEAVDQIDSGQCAAWQPGEGGKILDEVIRRGQERMKK